MFNKDTINMLWKCLMADIMLFLFYVSGWYLTEAFEMYAWVYLAVCIAGPVIFGYIFAWILIKMSVGNVGMWRKIRDSMKDYRQKEGIAMLIVAGVGIVLFYGMYLYASVFVMLFNNIFLWQAVAVLFTEGFIYFFGNISVEDSVPERELFMKYYTAAFYLNVVIYTSAVLIDGIL